MSKKRIVWYGESATGPTGFSTVARNVLTRLVTQYPDEFEVFQMGIGYHPYTIYDRNIIPFEIVAPYGNNDKEALSLFCQMMKPDVLIVNHDSWITRPLTDDDFLPNRKFPIVYYQPLDGMTQSGGIPLSWANTIRKQDYTIVYANWAREAYLKTVPDIANRLFTITHGVDLECYKPMRDSMESDPTKFLVGMVATNQYRKSHPALIEAVSIARKECPNLYLNLHCTQTSPVGFDIKQLLFDFNIMDCTVDTMFNNNSVGNGAVIPLDKMASIYNSFDIHILSTTGEGFGLPHAEAMACGIPALAVDYSTLHDLMPFEWQRIKVDQFRPLHTIPLQRAIIDTKDMANKICEMYHMDPEKRIKMGLECREFIKKYTWDNTIPQWANTINHIINQGRK